MSSTMELAELGQLLRRRRTIKPVGRDGQPNYQDRPVPAETLRTLLENATWAPTHGLTEPWRFVVFTGPGRDPLIDFVAHAYSELLPADQQKPGKRDKVLANLRAAPCLIALGMTRHAGKISAEDELAAVACAVQNLHLSATAAGLGGFWSSNPVYDLPETRHFLGLNQPQDRCLGMFFLGYPRGDWPARPNGAPQPLDDKVEWRTSE